MGESIKTRDVDLQRMAVREARSKFKRLDGQVFEGEFSYEMENRNLTAVGKWVIDNSATWIFEKIRKFAVPVKPKPGAFLFIKNEDGKTQNGMIDEQMIKILKSQFGGEIIFLQYMDEQSDTGYRDVIGIVLAGDLQKRPHELEQEMQKLLLRGKTRQFGIIKLAYEMMTGKSN